MPFPLRRTVTFTFLLTLLFRSTPEARPQGTPEWRAVGELRGEHGVWGFGMATLLDGKVLVVGAGGYLNTVGVIPPADTRRIYDPEAGSWEITGGGSCSRCTLTVLASGGELYAGSGTVTTKSVSPGFYGPVTLRFPSWFDHTATLLLDGNVLLAGGVGGSNQDQVLSASQLYDPASQVWTTAGNMHSPRAGHSAMLLADGRVLVVGGKDATSPVATAELYDPATRTWNLTAPMAAPRAWHAATLLPSGKVLITGGIDGTSVLSRVEVYDPNTATWTGRADMQTARAMHTATLLADGKVLITGGTDGHAALAGAEVYDPEKDEWTATASMASPRVRHGATLLRNGSVLVFGGSTGECPPPRWSCPEVPEVYVPSPSDNPAPEIASVSPEIADVASGVTSILVTISGRGFLPSSVVEAGGKAAVTLYISPATLKALIPAPIVPSAFEVAVRNPPPGGGVSNPARLNVKSVLINSCPAISELRPTVLPVATEASIMQIRGTGFSLDSIVLLDGNPADAIFVSSTLLEVLVPARLRTGLGSIEVKVRNRLPGGGDSNAVFLTIAAQTTRTYHVFPQVFEGRRPDGLYYRSSFMIAAPDTSDLTACVFRVRGLSIKGGNVAGNTFSGDTYSFTVNAGGWDILRTSGEQDFSSGYASLECTQPVHAHLMYSVYDASGTVISETIVPSAPPSTEALLISDQDRNARLWIAVANDSDASGQVHLQIEYRLQVATPRSQPAPASLLYPKTLTIAARAAVAAFIDELIPSNPDLSLYGIDKVILTSDSGAIHVAGLRYNGMAFSPVLPFMNGPMAVESQLASRDYVFPLLAAGKLEDGWNLQSWVYAFFPDTGTPDDLAQCEFRIRGFKASFTSIGGALSLIFPPQGGVRFSLNPRSFFTQKLQLDAEAQYGYATLSCTRPVVANVYVSVHDPSGKKTSEAPVFPSWQNDEMRFLADGRDAIPLSVVIWNDTDERAGHTVVSWLHSGELYGQATISLEPRTGVMSEAREWVGMPEVGMVTIKPDKPVLKAPAVGLRYRGKLFTTVPNTGPAPAR